MTKIDPWAALRSVRQLYLTEQPIPADYWSDDELLQLYDQSLAARIGWKWSAVLAELKGRGYQLAGNPTVLDWGCGTGIAARTFLPQFPGAKAVYLHDRSVKAQEFSYKKTQSILKANEISAELSTGLPKDHPELILVSHVLTELEGHLLTNLKRRLQFAQSFIWVEPGTHNIGRALPAIRDEFLKLGWTALGPCTHQKRPCGVIARERDWCHNFAPTPGHVHHDAFWAKVRDELSIDLRRTPFSYLAMQRTPVFAGQPEPGIVRVLGDARIYKGYGKFLLCCERNGQSEVGEFTLQKRDAPALLKAAKNGLESPFLKVEFGPKDRFTVNEPASEPEDL